jgi:Leucine-rich repeat (LRR) protein
MKKLILSTLTVLAMSAGINAQNVNIPDANFKSYLVGNAAINTSGDTEIQVSEASAFSGTINVYLYGISDLTGIEAFTALTELNCGENYSLGNLDVSQNTALTYLNCSSTLLTSLDLSQNTALTDLTCHYNSLVSLDLSQNTALINLQCHYNSLVSLDLSQNTALTTLACNNNALTTLNVTNGNNTNVTYFDANTNPNLACIQVDDVTYSTSNWTNIDAASSFSTNCGAPCTVNIPDANFKANLVGNTAINTNGNTEIECSEASSFTGIISCPFASIVDLTGIQEFVLLTELYCDNNNITSLDLSNNTNLVRLNCSFNNLSSLNVANGNNSNFTSFGASFNPNLTCIQVDDVAYSTTNWTNIDAASSFSTNCTGGPILVSSISVQGQGGASTITTAGETLQMEATVLPANADDATYTWSVMDGSGSASIDPSGLLTAITDGTVTVIANSNDASGIAGTATITISNQTAGIKEKGVAELVEVYPNPVSNILFIELGENKPTVINILDFSGKVVKSIANNNVKSIDVSDLQQGVYILKVVTVKGVSTKRFIKQ